ncbi:RDD family protein [Sabulibacter ruber]|uniref:RDD family protein n=1 Tax=Sabulibacter ruber TaxID=2811901 RepID=UPI001A9577D0|nr:RDD family protein [Sabulibacter ruber]
MEHNSTADSFFSDIYESSHQVAYAGFWIRFVAVLIDGIVLAIPNVMLQFLFIGSTIYSQEAIAENPFIFFASMGTYILASTLLNLLYKAVMESSSWQATLGKRALDLKVTDVHGQRISFLRALGRSLATFLSSLLMCIGYIMAAFSSRKQALHDKIAGTVVVKTRS